MVRDPRARRGLLLLASALPFLVIIGGTAGQVARSAELSFNILLLTPTMFLSFAVLAIASPLTSGGGNELFPPEQLVSFPVRPSAVHFASLICAPLNLAWSTQVVALVAATSFVADQGPLVLLSLVTTLAYVVLASAVGQALGWYVVGLRQSASGRRVTSALGLLAGSALGAVLATGNGVALLDRSPTTAVSVAALQGSQARLLPWATVTGLLVAAAALSLWAGTRTAAWALRQPDDDTRLRTSRRLKRHAEARGSLHALLRADRASVWRSAPLRRGLLVIGVLPGLVAAAAHVSWASMTLLPGLVAAGAGLLFGVNAFCLDGSGGIWLASLPHEARTSALAKILVTAETCLCAVLLALLVGAAGAPESPTAVELTALVSAVVASCALVVARCLRFSVQNPHRADLRGPRDSPAPPASMAVYSLRLTVTTTFVGLLFVGAASSGALLLGPALAGVALLRAGWSLRSSVRRFERADVRAHVITTVAFG